MLLVIFNSHFVSQIVSNVDSVVENIEKEIEQNANLCNVTKSIGIKPTKDAQQKNRYAYGVHASTCDDWLVIETHSESAFCFIEIFYLYRGEIK